MLLTTIGNKYIEGCTTMLNMAFPTFLMRTARDPVRTAVLVRATSTRYLAPVSVSTNMGGQSEDGMPVLSAAARRPPKETDAACVLDENSTTDPAGMVRFCLAHRKGSALGQKAHLSVLSSAACPALEAKLLSDGSTRG